MHNIIFDFGNVLVQWHPELVYGEYFGDEAKAWWFLRHVADNAWRLRIDGGESTDTCIRELKTQYPDYAEAIELYRSRWRELGWEPSLQFEEGIEKTVRWYLDNQEWMDNITSGDYVKYYEDMYANR